MFIHTLPKPAILIAFVPVSIYLSYMNINPALLFIISGLGILGLISVMSKSTDQLSITLGPVAGGLLNASFGNFPELLIGMNSIKHGMQVLARSAIAGSIIGNILLTVGLAMFFGGLKYKTEKFSRTGIGASILMLAVALVAIVVPTFVNFGFKAQNIADTNIATVIDKISIGISIVLLVVYVLYLIFSLKTHRSFFSTGGDASEKPDWSKGVAATILFIVAILVAYESDIFVAAIKGMLSSNSALFTEMFMGMIFVAAIGNAVGVGVAVNMSRKNKMDLAFQVSIGASIQIALLVVPLLVFYSFIVGQPFTLVFSGLELIAIWACAIVSGYALLDGESNWFEGAMLVAVYVILAIAFFFHP